MPLAVDSSTGSVPVTILTGTLGAGKTTLLNRLLSSSEGSRYAVVVNEFGEIGIDADLVETRSGDLLELVTGCFCCQAKDDFAFALRRLLPRLSEIDGILVETSGLSDPLPVSRTLLEDFVIASACHLSAIVAVVDTSRLCRSELTAVEYNQIAVADRIVLSKTDLSSELMLASAEKRIQSINPTAEVLNCVRCSDYSDLLREAYLRDTGMMIAAPAEDHGRAISSISLTLDGEVNEERFMEWLGPLVRGGTMEVLRSKGIIAIAGYEKRFVIHTVGELVDGAPERAWKEDEQRYSRMVFIGKRLNTDRLRTEFEACAA